MADDLRTLLADAIGMTGTDLEAADAAMGVMAKWLDAKADLVKADLAADRARPDGGDPMARRYWCAHIDAVVALAAEARAFARSLTPPVTTEDEETRRA